MHLDDSSHRRRLYHAAVVSVRQSLIHVGNLLTSFGRSLGGGSGRKKDANFASAVNDVVRAVEMHVEEAFPFILKSAWASGYSILFVSPRTLMGCTDPSIRGGWRTLPVPSRGW